jgi:hypothetical protein
MSFCEPAKSSTAWARSVRLFGMDLRTTMLYEDFQQARLAAVEVTDRYRDAPADDPCKDALWRDVVSRTDLAHQLLKRWLAEVDAPEPELALSAR